MSCSWTTDKGLRVDTRAQSTEAAGQCPFGPGEEEVARAYLESPHEIDSLHVSEEEFQAGRGLAFVSGFFFVFVIVLCTKLLLWYLKGFPVLGSWWDLGFLVGLPLLFGGGIHLLEKMDENLGPLLVSAHSSTISLGGRRLAHFAELGVPRRSTYARVSDHDPEHIEYVVPVIVLTTLRGEREYLFSTPVPSAIQDRLDEIADHINAMLLEYHQREAVRDWLARREAEISTGRPYRRDAGVSR